MNRRSFNQCLIAGGLWAAGGAALRVSANTGIFELASGEAVLHDLFGHHEAQARDDLKISLPYQAQAGQRVPASVDFPGSDVRLIALVAEDNPHPLSTYIRLSGARGYYSALLRLRQSSRVTAYVQTGQGLYAASARIKLSLGGYGAFAVPGDRPADTAPSERIETRLRVRRRTEATEVLALVTHPMTREGQEEDHFIHTLSFSHNGLPVAEARLGPNVASHPITGIQLAHTETGDRIAVDWQDNRGLSGHAEAVVS